MAVQEPVQKPLTLLIKINDIDKDNFKKFRGKLQAADEKFQDVFKNTNIVHFARFVLLDGHGGKELGIFTVYDGELEKYIEDFVELGHQLIEGILEYAKYPPPRPIIEHRLDFVAWVVKRDSKWLKENDPGADTSTGTVTFFSAYPGRKVIDIVE